MARETWATGAGKPPRKVEGADIVREARAGADLHSVDAKVVKMKTVKKTRKKGK